LPAAQFVVPCGFWQLTAQFPQLATLVRSLSQPFAGLSSQSWKLAWQLGVQTPMAHPLLPCALLQVRVQLPQLAACSAMSVSQPLVGVPSQSA
jgi:hypothetical protein